MLLGLMNTTFREERKQETFDISYLYVDNVVMYILREG